MGGWIVVILILGGAAYLVKTYNTLVANRQLTQQGWSGLDQQLRRRADLVPDLLEAAKGHLANDPATLGAVTAALAAVEAGAGLPAEQRAQLEGRLSSALGRLMAAVAADPDFEADPSFRERRAAFYQVEDELQQASRIYDDAARKLNVAVNSFPSWIVAALFRFAAAPYFEMAPSSAPPSIT